MSMTRVVIPVRSMHEPRPSDQWAAFFHRVWPSYKSWFLSEGYTKRPGYLTSARRLERYMLELMPVYEKLVSLSGGADIESRFLTLWCPPPFLAGCSQIAWTKHGNYLLRNYDYSPMYFDGVLLYSEWIRPVIGMVDCTWGLLDGMNGCGLAASLTFGGRKITGEGFGIPLVLRYVLETCDTTEEAIDTFKRIPIHMSYNVTLIDKSGKYATLYLGPDRQPSVINEPTCTNHQHGIEWTDYAELTSTVERKTFLDICSVQESEDVHTLLRKFLKPPLYSTRFDKAFGTLYTVLYDLSNSKMELHWPDKQLHQSFDNFKPGKTTTHLQRYASGKLVG